MSDANHAKTDLNCISVRPKVRLPKTADTQELTGESADKKYVKVVDNDGNQNSFPALHQRFAECLVYIKYRPPPKSVNGPVVEAQSKEMFEWLEMVYIFEQNLRTLLRLPFHRFWATVIHEKGFHLMLESYLCHAPRFFDSTSTLITDQMKESINEIHKLVFKVFMRMSNFKESKKDHLSVTMFGQVVYDNFVFDVPKLMELCALYGNISQQVNEQLFKMIDNLFKYQKTYHSDLQSSVISVISSLQRMQREYIVTGTEMPSSSSNASKLRNTNWFELQDIVYFIVDLAVTLSTFVSIYAPAARLYHKHRFESTLISFYENVFPPLKEEIDFRSNDNSYVRQYLQELLQQLTIARHYFIKCFRDVVVISCVRPLYDHTMDLDSKSLLIDDYLEMIASALSDRCFAQDYFAKYPFVEDLSALMEQSDLTGFRNVDQTRIDYLLCTSSCTTVNSDGNTKNTVNNVTTNGEQSRKIEEVKSSETADQFIDVVDDQSTISRATVESCISNITDIFPDLGHGFIEVCLQYYNNDVEKVVDALLTGSLPDSIDKLDRSLTENPNTNSLKTDKKLVVNTIQRSSHNDSSERSTPVLQKKPLVDLKSEVSVGNQNSDYFENHRNDETNDANVPNNLVATSSNSVKFTKTNSLPPIDDKVKTIIKLAAIRIEEEYAMENEYEDEYDDTYDVVDSRVLDTDVKFLENDEKRNNRRG